MGKRGRYLNEFDEIIRVSNDSNANAGMLRFSIFMPCIVEGVVADNVKVKRVGGVFNDIGY